MTTEYILQLRDNKDNWTYNDDFHRTICFETEEGAACRAASLMARDSSLVAAEVVRVQKTTVIEIFSKIHDPK